MIVYSIVVTALLMAGCVCLGYEHVWRVKTQERAAELERELFEARERVYGYQLEKANRDGVDAGMAADKMFRQFLEQFDARQQVTVLLQRNDARYYQAKHG